MRQRDRLTEREIEGEVGKEIDLQRTWWKETNRHRDKCAER